MAEDPKSFSVVRALSNLTGEDYWEIKHQSYAEAFERAVVILEEGGIEHARRFLIRYGLPDPKQT